MIEGGEDVGKFVEAGGSDSEKFIWFLSLLRLLVIEYSALEGLECS